MKPRLLDLFCGAGGAAVGYARAGFEVVGVDIVPQPRYPFAFHQDDALVYLAWLLTPGAHLGEPFDVIHASPPCQFATSLKSMANAGTHDNLIPPIRDMLRATGLPYVIENVLGAREHLIRPYQLCGSSFGLGIKSLCRGLRRHRLFETNVPLLVPPCAHKKKAVGIYGDHLRLGRRSSEGEFSGSVALAYASEAMRIDWMTWAEITQAIPPAYTELIGAQLLDHLRATAAA